MSILRVALVLAVLLSAAPAHAAMIAIDSLPAGFATALATPGRQIVGGEPSIDFNIATDVFAINGPAFGVTQVNFVNSFTGALPDNPFTVVVVQDLPANAALAANRISAQLTTPGPGFFVYFNEALQLPRLVFSADLSAPDADLAVLARMPNLSEPGGFVQMPDFTAANFTVVPEPATLLLVGAGLAGTALRRRRTKARSRL